MSVAYILEQGTVVNLEGERLLVKKGNTLLHTLHLFKLDQLVLFGNVSLTPRAMGTLLSREVDTVFMTRSGRYRGRLQPLASKNITLRCQQFRRMSDERFQTETARAIVLGKVANLRTNLMRMNRNRQDVTLDDSILSLKQLMKKVETAADTDSIRGYEGRAAAVYFGAFAKGLLHMSTGSFRRVRRPPTDPVNAILSLGYTFLFNSVLSAVSLAGFDPYLGCLHMVEYGRPSLPLDLMEEWRPLLIDTLAQSVFNLKVLTVEDFVRGTPDEEDEDRDLLAENGANEADTIVEPPVLPVKLTDGGFRKFLSQFERKMNEKVRYHLTGQQLTYRDCIREQVYHFARYVKGEDQAYQPMPSR
jgi:CRISPR-associated protein Cas1